MTEAFIEKTQKELGAVITAPKLTDKLLSKPPFRFLHDIVTSFIKTSGFPEDLYASDLLDSANVTDKEKKMHFLELLIAAVEAGTGKKCGAQPSKIVAGHEPDKTNEMLQLLAECAALPADRKAAAVKRAKGGGDAAPAKPKEEKAPGKEAAAAKEKEKEKEREREKERKEKDKEKEKEKEREKKERDRERDKEKDKEKDKERDKEKDKERDKEKEREERRRRERSERSEREDAVAEERESGTLSPVSRPMRSSTSAGKAPPRTKPTHEVVEGFAAGAAPAAGVIRERPREDGAEADWVRVAEAQAEAARPVGEAGGEARGYLGQQAQQAQREQAAQQQQQQRAATGGGIVIHSSKGGKSGSAMAEGELSKLREQLQMLIKASNPLGKLLEAIHDDIDTMARELEMWRSEARSQALAAADARRQTTESLQEVQAQLQNLEDAIGDQILKTHNIRRNVMNNNKAIEGMVRMIVSPDIGKRG